MESSVQVDGGQTVFANAFSAVFKVQVDECRPLGIVFLVNRNVVAVAYEVRLGRSFDLNPGVRAYGRILAELGFVHHDADLVSACAAFHRNLDQEVMVTVADEGNFDVVAVEFLRNFVLPVDGVLEKAATFDFPAVINAATGAKACCTNAKTGTDA